MVQRAVERVLLNKEKKSSLVEARLSAGFFGCPVRTIGETAQERCLRKVKLCPINGIR